MHDARIKILSVNPSIRQQPNDNTPLLLPAKLNLFPTRLRHRHLSVSASLFCEINLGAAAAAAARSCDGRNPRRFLPPIDLNRGRSAAESLPDGPLIAADEAAEKRPRSMRAQFKKRRMGARRRCLLSKNVNAWQSPGVHKSLLESHSFEDEIAGAGRRDGGAPFFRPRPPRSAPSCCKNEKEEIGKHRNYSLPLSAQNMRSLKAECK